jgi:23S rRNA pseudouridine1911/1915/1917 synthase
MHFETFEPETLPVLYYDNHLLVINKPAGLRSQGDRSGAPTVLFLAKAWLKAQFNKPGNVYLGLVHRLDAPVSGVMVLARTSKAAARLMQQFRDRTVQKIIWRWWKENWKGKARGKIM